MLEPIFHEVDCLPGRGFLPIALNCAITDIHPYYHPLTSVGVRPTLHLVLYHVGPLLEDWLFWDQNRFWQFSAVGIASYCSVFFKFVLGEV